MSPDSVTGFSNVNKLIMLWNLIDISMLSYPSLRKYAQHMMLIVSYYSFCSSFCWEARSVATPLHW